jgi:hypothetical protein
MKNVSAITTLTLAALMLVGCKSPPASASSSGDEAESCTEPQNPYDEGSGHYAGYEWAAEHSGICETGSTSFNEGCDEYDSQEDAYNKCVAKR